VKALARVKASWVIGEMQRRMAALGAGWPDTTGAQVYSVHDIHPFLADLLVAEYGVKQVIKRRKRSASVPAPEEIVRELADQCDVVIAGSGD